MRRIDPDAALMDGPSTYQREQDKPGRTRPLTRKQRQRMKSMLTRVAGYAQEFASVVHTMRKQLDEPGEHVPVDEWAHMLGGLLYQLQEMQAMIDSRMPLPGGRNEKV